MSTISALWSFVNTWPGGVLLAIVVTTFVVTAYMERNYDTRA